MKNLARIPVLIAIAVLPVACTWVNPSPSGDSVRVAYDGNVSGCRDAGTVGVSVTDKVAFYHRSELKVRDELETLARNEAATLPADTIKALGEPKDGAQRFQAYVCGRTIVRQRAVSRDSNLAPASAETQTFPVQGHR
ncbi:MAG: DUF4156 domain-containing protein [Rudaea sp.]